MAEYLAPGVYVEEVERGAAPLEGVSTSTAGFLGPTERGPTAPRLITSFADFERTYGGHIEGSHLVSAVEGFFGNGGSRCYVGRITAEDDDAATGKIPVQGTPPASPLSVDTAQIDFGALEQSDTDTRTVALHYSDSEEDDLDIVLEDDAAFETTMGDVGFSYAWGDGSADDDVVTFEPGTERTIEIEFDPDSVPNAGGVHRHWARFTLDLGGEVRPVSVTLVGYNDDAPAEDLLAADPSIDFGAVDDDDGVMQSLTVEHETGDDVTIDADASMIVGPDADAFTLDESGTIDVDADESVTLDVEFDPSSDGGRREATLVVAHDGDDAPLVVELCGWSGAAMAVDAVGPGAWGGHVALVVDDASMYEPDTNELFKLTIRYWADGDDIEDAKAGDADPTRDGVPEPDVEEVFDDLSPDEKSSNFYVKQVNDVSMLVDLEKRRQGRPATDGGAHWLESPGEDGSIETADYEGDATVQPEYRTGFAGFETVDDIAIVCVPDEHAHAGLTEAVVEHCESMNDRFAILQAERSPGPVGDLRPPQDTDMAAFYYPWLEVLDPETGMTTEIPPGGHVAGIYARSDASHGVHKAPANEVVRGIQGLQRTITKGEQEVLNPRGVNCIRGFRGRGVRVWGARTASSDPNWKYVNVRRLFLFLRESIDEGTQWVVFEPNNEQLWARVRQTITNFLTDVWDDGALMGTSPDEAFFVKCDRSTMTQSDIENGRLICEIGVAPVRPAEFVVFRIAQWTGGAE